ncbi:MAG TPA: hypothetical protein PLT76_08800 [Candidatus Omnitrophota bacterium]|mgnify:CR=1 FL=1|nr:hypothetical protein [Candidatus Omnitrophota bacterium]HPB67304.1 hypothetical protein [Candidatus Omnitrophota bacterium]HQO58801.1 hypothetical protein [Candidatus Omnitrophota bacterium]HQP11946.1 hypothetical protein [Candidatus Omnitrophota bacterium]
MKKIFLFFVMGSLILPLSLAVGQEEPVSAPIEEGISVQEEGEEAVSPAAQEETGSLPREEAAATPSKWQDTVRSLRRQTEMLLEKNKTLNEEYSYLQNSMTEAEDRQKQLEKEIEEYRRENERLLDQQKKNTLQQQEMKKKQLQMQKEMEPLQKHKQELEDRWMGVKKETQDWHDRISALEQEKKALITQLKNLEISKDDMAGALDEEIKKLDSILQEYEEEGSLVDLEKESYVREEQEIARINAVLEEDIEGFEDEEQQVAARIGDVEKKKAELKKKKQPERLPPELVKEKQRLEQQVKHLADQLETIKKSVEDTSAVLEKKRDLMDEIMKIDEENRRLRQQISDMADPLEEANP